MFLCLYSIISNRFRLSAIVSRFRLPFECCPSPPHSEYQNVIALFSPASRITSIRGSPHRLWFGVSGRAIALEWLYKRYSAEDNLFAVCLLASVISSTSAWSHTWCPLSSALPLALLVLHLTPSCKRASWTQPQANFQSAFSINSDRKCPIAITMLM